MKIFAKITTFVKEVKVELGKVAWSSRQELIQSTAVVIGTTIIMAMFLFAVDSFLSKTLSVLLK